VRLLLPRMAVLYRGVGKLQRAYRSQLSLNTIVKTESSRKLSNFDIQCTKTSYQNNLKNAAFFLHFSRAKDEISYL